MSYSNEEERREQELRDVFQAAYYYVFGKIIPEEALLNDVCGRMRGGPSPAYVVVALSGQTHKPVQNSDGDVTYVIA